MRELDRLRRASTVEIHGRDISTRNIGRGRAKFVSRNIFLLEEEEEERKFEANFYSYFRGGGLYLLRAHLQCKMINGIREENDIGKELRGGRIIRVSLIDRVRNVRAHRMPLTSRRV